MTACSKFEGKNAMKDFKRAPNLALDAVLAAESGSVDNRLVGLAITAFDHIVKVNTNDHTDTFSTRTSRQFRVVFLFCNTPIVTRTR